jgi:putative nucleotidyltransferase with HDIG domain
VDKTIDDYVRALDLDAYLVGGAVRDELRGIDSKDADFLVPGVDVEGLRSALEPHGRVEDLVVADRLVGVRLHPRDRAVRALAPAGIEFAPPREEQSTGPGRHDFVIVANPNLSVEDDMRRRDFTVNAMARRLADGTLVDPLGGRADLERGILRTVSPRSFQEDPLRIVRGLRFVSQLGLDPDDDTRRQMREEAPAVRLVSGERLGDETAKLLLGPYPAKALRLARDTGVLVELLPESRDAIGFEQPSARQELSLDEHIFAVVQATADAGDAVEVRLAALLHDLGKPTNPDPRGHAEVGAALAQGALTRLRFPARVIDRVTAIVREHPFRAEDLPRDPAAARRFLREHGDKLAFDLAAHRCADLHGKRRNEAAAAAVERFRALLEQERSSPHRVADLAVDGDDLIGLGFREGPELGRALQVLLDDVVRDPSQNDRTRLLERAKELR